MNPKKLALTKFDFERGISAEFKYTVSRGRDTYGYNICTLYINGHKVASCTGGGYDMQGTCLGDWMQAQFTEELKALEAGTSKIVKTKKGQYQERYGFCGLFFNVPGEPYASRSKYVEGAKVQLDGGCGINCMTAILKAIGYVMVWLPTRKRNDNIYMIQPVEVTK